MLTVKCPVRISLIGGSSDLDSYIDFHGKGSVISFTPNLYTYVSLYRDIVGRNNLDKKYIVNYSKREETTNINDIQNDLVRVFFKEFSLDPCSVHMTSDVFSHGSGLAVSSSYATALSMASSLMQGKNPSDIECGMVAHRLEKTINPLLGMQDVFGCCVGGFKKIEFIKGQLPRYTFLPTDLFREYDICLLFTGHTRSSTEVLKTINVPKIDKFNEYVDNAESSLIKNDFKTFMELINLGWIEKKNTSKSILENQELKDIDHWLTLNTRCKAHKLCGAGNGGFFLCFFEKDQTDDSRFHKISLSTHGVKVVT
jgi:D-glycero-alpha-D-manno-heptose-7-phosphate kinase